jgi:RNA polymerase sigma-70 factor (ECF subfamily)
VPNESEDLLQRAKAHDQAAIDALLEQHLPGLRAFVRLRSGALLRQKESNSDLVQSVCRDVLENLGRFEHGGETGFKQWLYRTALRKIADRYEYWGAKKRAGGREVPIDPSSSSRGSVSSAGDEQLLGAYRAFCSPSQHAIAREELERVEGAFERLAEDQREVILLAKIVGLSRVEIAQQLGKSEGAIRTMLSRALADLAEQLEEPNPPQ